MASSGSTLAAEDDVFERLKTAADPTVLQERQDAVRERVQAQYERAQKRLAELIQNNSTLPVYIRSVHVDGANRTRRFFLEKIFEPVLKGHDQVTGKPISGGYILETAMRELQRTTGKLHQFEIFRPEISISLDTTPPELAGISITSTAPQARGKQPPTPLDVLLSVKERGLFTLKSGTDFGNTSATGYLTASTINALGLADKSSISFSAGTRTRSSAEVNIALPLPPFSNPDLTFSASGYSSTRDNRDFASHELLQKGGRVGLRYVTPETKDVHDISWEGVWRTISILPVGASASVRKEAGDSVISALKYMYMRDWRDHPLLPTRGYMFKSTTELAGGVPGIGRILGGDVQHIKYEAELQLARTLLSPVRSSPSSPQPSPLHSFLSHSTLTTTFRTGLLYPLTSRTPTRLPDRFHLGGPTSLRSFRECGLGPHDGRDALGGDLYLSGCASLLFPIPRVGPEKPLRIQTYLNAGRLLAWEDTRGPDVRRKLRELLGTEDAGWPSASVGVGLVYVTSVARFEVNFGVPVVVRAGERGRKGFQIGVGINVM